MHRICFVSSEVVPYAKTGGLADVSGALARYLSHRGCDIRMFMPFYSTIDTSRGEFHYVEFLRDVRVELQGESITFGVVTTRVPDSNCDIYFIDCPRFFARGKIYTDDADEYLRFAFLSRAAIECCQRMGWAPQIFHCNDWQTALIPLMLRTIYKWDNLFADTRTILTIHNIAYQGVFGADVIDRIGMGEYRSLFDGRDVASGIVNYMKTGIMYADILTTVSETYAREIQTAEYGAGLEGMLRWRSDALVGIVNGVDYDEWGPENDQLIPFNYSIDDLSGKEKNKKYLLESLGLSYDPDVPVLGIVSRLTGQKGFDLFFDILDDILRRYDVRMTILGSGEPTYEQFFSGVESRYPGRVAFYRGFQNSLAHLIEAGADIFLMPSRYEPCGLNQIYSLRYGTIPVVRKTGGLADTVQNFDHHTGEGTGFVFEHYTGDGLRWAMESAIKTFYHKDSWRRLMHNAMSCNYSWDVQVEKYLQLYRMLAGG